MTDAMKTIAVTVERVIPAPPEEVFDAWLNPETPGTTWHAADRYVLDPEVECYNLCNAGWEGHVMKSLQSLIAKGVGTPQ